MIKRKGSGVGMDIINDCLVVPVRDEIDRASLADLSHEMFEKVRRGGCRRVIINISAVKVMDSRSFLMLRNAAKAINMMGGMTVFVGIRPGVACSLVDLDLDLSSIHTAVTTQDADKLFEEAGYLVTTQDGEADNGAGVLKGE